jgi:hypothetical protein
LEQDATEIRVGLRIEKRFLGCSGLLGTKIKGENRLD